MIDYKQLYKDISNLEWFNNRYENMSINGSIDLESNSTISSCSGNTITDTTYIDLDNIDWDYTI